MHPVQRDIFRNMTPEQKLKVAERLYWSARELKAAALRQQHPGWSEAQVQQAVKESFLYASSG